MQSVLSRTQSILVVVPLLLVASCGPRHRLEYEFDTEVTADGAWTRTYTATGMRKSPEDPHASEYEEIQSVHCAARPPCPDEETGEVPGSELPPCADDVGRAVQSSLEAEKCGVLLTRKIFRRSGVANAAIAPDISWPKTLRGNERVAGNQLAINRYDLGPLVFYEYRESFRQWLTPGDVIDIGLNVLDLGLALGLEIMHAELDADYETSRLEAYARDAVAEVISALAVYAFTDMDGDAAEDELERRMRRRGVPLKANGEIDFDRLGPWFDAELTPLLVPKRREVPALTWRLASDEIIRDHLQQAWSDRVEALTAEDGPLHQLLRDLDSAFVATRFRLRLRLPGHVIDTDGAIGLDSELTWGLDPHEFDTQPREVHAVSIVLERSFSKLYPTASRDGRGLVAIAQAAAELDPDSRARLPQILRKHDVEQLRAWLSSLREAKSSGDGFTAALIGSKLKTIAHHLGVELE